jgi:hypothetical protein
MERPKHSSWLVLRSDEPCTGLSERAFDFLMGIDDKSGIMDDFLLWGSSLNLLLDYALETHCPNLWRRCRRAGPSVLPRLVNVVSF